MLTHKQLRAKALGRAEVEARFDELGEKYALLDEFLKARVAVFAVAPRLRSAKARPATPA